MWIEFQEQKYKYGKLGNPLLRIGLEIKGRIDTINKDYIHIGLQHIHRKTRESYIEHGRFKTKSCLVMKLRKMCESPFLLLLVRYIDVTYYPLSHMNEIMKVSEIEATRLGNSDGATLWRRPRACVISRARSGAGMTHSAIHLLTLRSIRVLLQNSEH